MKKIKAKQYVEEQLSINKSAWKKYVRFSQTNNAVNCEHHINRLQEINLILEAWQILCEKASIEFIPTTTLDGIKRCVDFTGNYSEEDTDKLVRAVALGRGLYE
jgi:hypothetical protein